MKGQTIKIYVAYEYMFDLPILQKPSIFASKKCLRDFIRKQTLKGKRYQFETIRRLSE